jgi:hypothetical protein
VRKNNQILINKDVLLNVADIVKNIITKSYNESQLGRKRRVSESTLNENSDKEKEEPALKKFCIPDVPHDVQLGQKSPHQRRMSMGNNRKLFHIVKDPKRLIEKEI